MHAPRWNQDDKSILNANITILKKSYKIHRTPGAIYAKRCREGISKIMDFWTTDEIMLMLFLKKNDFTFKQIGEIIGRTQLAVSSKYHKIIEKNKQ